MFPLVSSMVNPRWSDPCESGSIPRSAEGCPTLSSTMPIVEEHSEHLLGSMPSCVFVHPRKPRGGSRALVPSPLVRWGSVPTLCRHRDRARTRWRPRRRSRRFRRSPPIENTDRTRTIEPARAAQRGGKVAEGWWPGTESNRRHADFQSAALPAELPGQAAKRAILAKRARIRNDGAGSRRGVAESARAVYPERRLRSNRRARRAAVRPECA